MLLPTFVGFLCWVFFPQEKVSSIPSVVIEPASNNEGEGEEHDVAVNESKDAAAEMGTQGTVTSPREASQVGSEQKLPEEIQAVPSQDQPVPGEDAASAMPPGFLYKVCCFILLLDVPPGLAAVDESVCAGRGVISSDQSLTTRHVHTQIHTNTTWTRCYCFTHEV